MKIIPFVLMLLAVGLSACNKEEAIPECEATAQLCVNLGNERISGAAVWYRIPNQNRFRLLWEEGTGSA